MAVSTLEQQCSDILNGICVIQQQLSNLAGTYCKNTKLIMMDYISEVSGKPLLL